MAEDVINSVSYASIVGLSLFLVALLLLLFFLYKYLNKEASGKYTVHRIVFRKGGLRDRARRTAVALGNRLGVQLWPQNETNQDEENEEDEEEASSNESESRNYEDDGIAQVNEQKSDYMTDVNDAKGSSGDNSEDSSDDDEQAEAKPEPQLKAEAVKKTEETVGVDVQENKAGETSAPIVISLNQFSGSVLWSEEDKCEGGDVTAL